MVRRNNLLCLYFTNQVGAIATTFSRHFSDCNLCIDKGPWQESGLGVKRRTKDGGPARGSPVRNQVPTHTSDVHAGFPRLQLVSTMISSQPPKGRESILSTLDVLIQALNLAKDACGIPPAQIAFGSASVLLTLIRVCFRIPCKDKLLTHASLGHDGQRSRLR